jgi:hypothetical protein
MRRYQPKASAEPQNSAPTCANRRSCGKPGFCQASGAKRFVNPSPTIETASTPIAANATPFATRERG